MSAQNQLELRWIGKNRRPPLEPSSLREESAFSYQAPAPENGAALCDNTLVYGDNLLALQALQERFAQQVRCVFIDPPYNTGSAFDQFDDSQEHSRWLSLIADRLHWLRKLMRDDGSLWISIDDHEGHYLKVVCDEIFGRANFIATVIWQKKYTQANDAEFFSDNHDFILVYAKNRSKLRLHPLPRSEKQRRAYKNPDHDPRGPWKSTPLHAKSGTKKDFCFTFSNGVPWRPPVGAYPRFSAENLARMDANNEIWFGRSGRAVPSRKTFLKDVRQGVVPRTIWLHDEVGQNHEARREARALVAEAPFATPKPERLLEHILTLATEPGDLVLDSFAGSGTTGAVAHKMRRRWIMVELGPHCHTHILPRMRAVIDGGDAGGVTESCGWRGGGGFRYYSLGR